MTNNKLSPVTLYVPINVGDGLPESKECSFIYWERDNTGKPMILSAAIFDFYNNGKFDVSDDNDEDQSNPRGAQPTHWLKEQERFIFTKEELENILGDAFDAGFKRGFDQPNVLKPDGQIYPDSVEHIQSLF